MAKIIGALIILIVIIGLGATFIGRGQPVTPPAPATQNPPVAITQPPAAGAPGPLIAQPPTAPTPAPAGPQAPAFSLKDLNGKTVSLADFKGQPLVINSWAAWCPFCKAELPDFGAAQKEFGKKVTIIAIDRAEALATAKKFADALGVSQALVMLLDPNDSFYQAIGGFSMPETIFVNSRGEITDHKRGPMDLTEIRQRINKLLSASL